MGSSEGIHRRRVAFAQHLLRHLVFGHDCSAVVVLCNPTSTVSNVYPSFWPDSTRSKKYGQVFTVEHVSHKHYPNIRTWVFRISKKIVSLTELMAGVKAPTK